MTLPVPNLDDRRFDVAHPCVIECAIDPGLFHEKGRFSVRAVYTRGGSADETHWEGTVRSQFITVEVR